MIDLHVHSIFSDGSLTPEELVTKADAMGLKAIALTDHDTTDGIDRFLMACSSYNQSIHNKDGKSLICIPGVEISADIAHGTMHLLGYFISHHDEGLQRVLREIKNGREERNKQILEKLNALGLKLSWEEVANLAQGDIIGRPHFARAMCNKGYVNSIDEAFARYLAKGKPAYAERYKLGPVECIRAICNAEGIAVLAHPFTLDRTEHELESFVKELVEAGLSGIEIYYPEHTAQQVHIYEKIAKRFNLLITGGSDFHGDAVPHIQLGIGDGSLNVPDHLVELLLKHREKNKILHCI
jgi:predicted metal-dependent phosphoesterase TrpH